MAALCAPSVGTPVPQRVLCQRVMEYLPELFTFLADPQVPPDNNGAERSIRPVAIRRAVSGGTRSPAGSTTRTLLWSLLDTWAVQGCQLLDTCQAMIHRPDLASV